MQILHLISTRKKHHPELNHRLGPSTFTEAVTERLRLFGDNVIGLDSDMAGQRPLDQPDLVVYQINAMTPFSLDVIFESESVETRRGAVRLQL